MGRPCDWAGANITLNRMRPDESAPQRASLSLGETVHHAEHRADFLSGGTGRNGERSSLSKLDGSK
jgi:hypothetical protein